MGFLFGRRVEFRRERVVLCFLEKSWVLRVYFSSYILGLILSLYLVFWVWGGVLIVELNI